MNQGIFQYALGQQPFVFIWFRALSETPLYPSLRLIFRQKSPNLIDVHSMYAS